MEWELLLWTIVLLKVILLLLQELWLHKIQYVESGSIYAGIPAKKVKDIDQSDFAGEIDRISNNYVMYSSWFKEE